MARGAAVPATDKRALPSRTVWHWPDHHAEVRVFMYTRGMWYYTCRTTGCRGVMQWTATNLCSKWLPNEARELFQNVCSCRTTVLVNGHDSSSTLVFMNAKNCFPPAAGLGAQVWHTCRTPFLGGVIPVTTSVVSLDQGHRNTSRTEFQNNPRPI